MYYKYRGKRHLDFYNVLELLSFLKKMGIVRHVSAYEDFGGRWQNINMVLTHEQ